MQQIQSHVATVDQSCCGHSYIYLKAPLVQENYILDKLFEHEQAIANLFANEGSR